MNFSSFSMKALTASLLLVSATSLAYAKSYKGENYKGEAMPCPPPLMLKDGWYIGAQVGYDSYRVRMTYDTPGEIPGNTFLIGNPVINSTGWVGGLMLGYGQYFTNLFYLGAEIFGNGSGAEQEFTASDIALPESYNGEFEARGSWGVALLPGIRLNDTSLGYLRFGWNWLNARVKEDITNNLNVFTEGSRRRTTNGFNFGLGIETLLWDAWSVRTEYSHTWYDSFHTRVPFETSIRPADNQFMLGVLYHFA